MNLAFKANQAIEFIQMLLDNNPNDFLWNKYFFAKVATDKSGFIQVEKITVFNNEEKFWAFKKNFNFPYFSLATKNNDLIIEIRTSDEFLTACTDKSQKVLFYEDYTDFVFLNEPPTSTHKKMLADLGFDYVLISNS